MTATHKRPLTRRGWFRGFALLCLYLLISLGCGAFIGTLFGWVAASAAVAIGLVYLFTRYIDRKPMPWSGIPPGVAGRDVLRGFCLASLLLSAGSVSLYFFGMVEWTNVRFNPQALLTALAVLLMVSIAEELVFRGYLLRNLLRSFSTAVALLVSAAAFALVHAGNPHIPLLGHVNIFLGGLVLGLLFLESRSIWMPLFFHFSWNMMQGPVIGFSVSGLEFGALVSMETDGPDLLTGGQFGFEASLVCSVLLILLLLFLIYRERRRGLVNPPAEA